MIKFYDTSSLLKLKEKAFEEPFVTSSIVINELENIKVNKNKTEDLRFSARQLVRLFNTHSNYEIVTYTVEHDEIARQHKLPLTNDNLISACAYEYYRYKPNSVFVTNDLILKLVASYIYKIPTDIIQETHFEKYRGYKKIGLSENEMEDFYNNLDKNYLGLLQNEYALIYDIGGNLVDRRKWDGTTNRVIQYKPVSNDYIGTIKPKNVEQSLAFDMLQDKDILVKVLTGAMGTGKIFARLYGNVKK